MKTFAFILGVLCLAAAGCSTDERYNPDPNLRTYNQTAPPNAVILPTNSVTENTPPSILAPPDNNGGNPTTPP